MMGRSIPWPYVRKSLSRPHRRSFARVKSTHPSATSTRAPAEEASPSTSPSQAFTKILSRSPKFLRPTLSALHNAPLTHITAFLLLHELTAIVPLFGLAGAFHYYHWLPPYFAEGAWVVAGVEKFGRYFKRKGWIGSGEEEEAERKVKEGKDLRVAQRSKGSVWWNRGEGGMRWVVEFATAYAVVKALLPVRIVFSVWGAPWFARWTILPIKNTMKRVVMRTKGDGIKSSKPGA